MAIAELNIIPIGTSTPSVGKYIADAVEILKQHGVSYELTSMGTIVEGELDEILDLAREMHETPFQKGVKRVVTTIRIDDRRDRKATSADKLKSVADKLSVK